MSIQYFPFDGGSGDTVNESQWSQWIKWFLRDGVIGTARSEGAVTQDSPTGMTTRVVGGVSAVAQGFFFDDDGSPTQKFTHSASDPTHDRIDRDVIRFDPSANTIAYVVIAGTPGASPTPPSIQRVGGGQWDLSLAQVRIRAGTGQILNSDITDERFNIDVCGWAWSQGPAAMVKSTSHPTTFPVGGLIFEQDSGNVLINVGSNSTPSWRALGPQFAAPTFVLDTAAAAGSASTVVRSDATIAAFDGTVPTTSNPGDAAATGSVAKAARRDHVHGREPGGAVPYAGIIEYPAGTTDPTGWYHLDGRAVDRTVDNNIFGVQGTTYGAGNGTTTFNLVDFRGRSGVAPDNMGTSAGAAGRLASNNALGNTGGAETFTLATGNLPVHSHAQTGSFSVSISDPQHSHGISGYFGQGGTVAVTNNANTGAANNTTNTNAASTGISGTVDLTGSNTGNAGSGTAFNKMHNYVVVSKIQKR